MSKDNKASTMAESILDYIYEEGGGKINYAEALGILEVVKSDILDSMKEEEE